MIDLDDIKKRIPKYGGGDIKALVEEVERLRAWVADLRAHAVSLHKATAAGMDSERAAVVAWMRKNANDTMTHPQTDRLAYARAYSALHTASDAIERGEHREEEP